MLFSIQTVLACVAGPGNVRRNLVPQLHKSCSLLLILLACDLTFEVFRSRRLWMLGSWCLGQWTRGLCTTWRGDTWQTWPMPPGPCWWTSTPSSGTTRCWSSSTSQPPSFPAFRWATECLVEANETVLNSQLPNRIWTNRIVSSEWNYYCFCSFFKNRM